MQALASDCMPSTGAQVTAVRLSELLQLGENRDHRAPWGSGVHGIGLMEVLRLHVKPHLKLAEEVIQAEAVPQQDLPRLAGGQQPHAVGRPGNIRDRIVVQVVF
eukprot:scaffold647865_cov40-Prasinocladus_malaysianus.AAC.1